jgi:hypothetical protein
MSVMFRLLLVVQVLLGGCGLFSAATPPGAVTEIRPSDGPMTESLAAAYRRGQERGMRTYAQVYGEWCAACRAVREYIDDPAMVEARKGIYWVRLEYDVYKDPARLAAGFEFKMPYIFEVMPDGSFGSWIDGDAWGENTPENMAPALAKFFQGREGNPAGPPKDTKSMRIGDPSSAGAELIPEAKLRELGEKGELTWPDGRRVKLTVVLPDGTTLWKPDPAKPDAGVPGATPAAPGAAAPGAAPPAPAAPAAPGAAAPAH